MPVQLRIKTVAGKETSLETDLELPLAVVRTQVTSALDLDQDVTLVHQGQILSPGDDEKSAEACGLKNSSVIVAVVKRPLQKEEASSSTPSDTAGIPQKASREGLADDDLARQLQADEDEATARRVQEEMDSTMAREEMARQALGDARAAEIAAIPSLCFVRGDFLACASWIPLLVDTGAQTSILTNGVAARLGLLGQLDHTAAGMAGGVGHAKVLGKLRNVVVKFGELELAVSFDVLDGSQMPIKNLAILGLDQLAVHHMVVDLDVRVLRIGGCEGYALRMLENYEIPEDFRPNAAASQRCSIQ